MASVLFFSEGIQFKLRHPRKTSSWIKQAIINERKEFYSLSVIFTTDLYLLELNVAYLKHRTLTDVITFNYSTRKNQISGEIYISLNRVKENAANLKIDFEEELHRVIIHGVLHLVGFTDKMSTKRAQMRKKEEAYLSLRS